MMPSNHLIVCCPLFLLCSVFPSVRVFSNESTLHIRWPKYWSFSFRISPSSEYSGLISFRIDLFDLAVQGTLKSLLQLHSLKTSILPRSAAHRTGQETPGVEVRNMALLGKLADQEQGILMSNNHFIWGQDARFFYRTQK